MPDPVCDTDLKFKSVTSITNDFLLNILEANFKMFLDWSFLHIGAWFDAQIPLGGTIYSQENPQYKLLLVDDPSFNPGQVWQGIRKDWVWETGVVCTGGNPVSISGVYLDDVFTTAENLTFMINYPLGRIVFEESMQGDVEVAVNHSYRHVQIYRANDSPWFNIIQYASYQNDNPDIVRMSEGEWSIGGNHRIQLPAIIIESVPRSRSRPYEIGSKALIVDQDMCFHVLAETKNERNKIMDILRLQQDLHMSLFDTNLLSRDDNFPLDYNGSLKLEALMYPDIIDQYRWRKCWIKTANLTEIESLHYNFHQGQVRMTLEIISP